MTLRPLQLLDAVRDLRGLAPAQKLVLLVLATRVDVHGSCFPSHALVADDTGLSKRTVITAIAELCAKGLLVSKPRASELGVQTSNLYRLTLVGVQQDHPPVQPLHPPVQEDHPWGAAGSPPPVQQDHGGSDPVAHEGSQLRIPNEGTQLTTHVEGGSKDLFKLETPKEKKKDAVEEIYDHYLVAKLRQNPRASDKTKPSPKERKAIKDRLSEKRTVEELKASCDGLFHSTFHVDNKHLSVGYALRPENIEKFIELAEAARPARGPAPVAARGPAVPCPPETMELLKSFLDRPTFIGADVRLPPKGSAEHQALVAARLAKAREDHPQIFSPEPKEAP